MTSPANSNLQNLLPVQAYFDLQGNFQTFIGQNKPFFATISPYQSGLVITNSTIDSTTIGANSPSTGIFTNISTTAGYYGVVTGGFAYIPGFTLEANGRISQANSTLLQVDTSMITSGTFPVARGGTGASTFTTNAVLLGQGTSAFTTASSSTEGHVLQINSSGIPTFAHLNGGSF